MVYRDLDRVTEDSVRYLVRQNIEYTTRVEVYYESGDNDHSDPKYRIYIDIYDIGQDALMEKLGFNSFQTDWSGFLY